MEALAVTAVVPPSKTAVVVPTKVLVTNNIILVGLRC